MSGIRGSWSLSRNRSLQRRRLLRTVQIKVTPLLWSLPNHQVFLLHPAYVVSGRIPSARVRSCVHGQWMIVIDGPTIKICVSIVSAVIIGFAHVRRSRDVKGARRSITHSYTVPLQPARKKAVTMRVKRNRVGAAFKYDTDGFIGYRVDSRS